MTAPDSRPPDDQAIYRLLGVSPGVSPERLRHVYEWAVGDASRRGDHQALLMLSQAFDKLKDKHLIYPSASGRPENAPHFPPSPESTGYAGSAPRRRVRGIRRARRTWRPVRPRTTLTRILGYGVAVPAIVVLLVVAMIRSNRGSAPHLPVDPQRAVVNQVVAPTPQPPVMSVPPDETTPATAPSTVSPMPVIIVPNTAPTAVDGLVRILCQLDGTTNGYVQGAPRGTRTSCANGATPRVLR